MRRSIIMRRTIIIMSTVVLGLSGSAFELPQDPATIEALISLHKCIKKDEDQALERVALSFGEQSAVTRNAKKFNEVRSTLDSKLNDAHSYVVLAASIGATGASLYQLIRDYGNFASSCADIVQKKPFITWYFLEANIAIGREIEHCYKLYASVGASGINLMRASMDQKLDLVMTLKNTIERAIMIIDHANLMGYILTNDGYKVDYIWEILNSDVRDDIAEALIYLWNEEKYEK